MGPVFRPFDLIKTDQVFSYNMGFQAFFCSFPRFYMSSLSTYSPCPVSHYLLITSSSCGLTVTMETSQFAPLRSTLVHIFSPVFLSAFGEWVYWKLHISVFFVFSHIGWSEGQQNNNLVWALLFLHHEKTLEIYWKWFMITNHPLELHKYSS